MNRGQSQRYKNEILSRKWGKLTPIEFIGYTEKSKRTLWKCKCDCGTEVIVRSDCLRTAKSSGSTKSCGCAGIQRRGKEAPTWLGVGDISGSKWASFRCGAKIRNLEFSISLEYAWDLFLRQNKKCALTNRDIFFSNNKSQIGSTASLDRIDSSRGYIEGNVQWVHFKINIMKMDMSTKEFISFCSEVVDHSSSNLVSSP